MRSIAYTEDVEALPGRGARAMRSIAYTEDVEALPGRGARAMRSIAYTEDVHPSGLYVNLRIVAPHPGT